MGEPTPPATGRHAIIQSVVTPLNFFALIVLAIEGILLILAHSATGDTHLLITRVMLVAFVGLILIFLVLAIFKPDVLASEAAAHDRAEQHRLEEAILGIIGNGTSSTFAILSSMNLNYESASDGRIKVHAALTRLQAKGLIDQEKSGGSWKRKTKETRKKAK